MISDMSLFEILTSTNIENEHIAFLTFLNDYKVCPIYKEIIPRFDEQYLNWFNSYSSINKKKEQLLPSFSFTLSSFLSTFTNAIIIFLANKLIVDHTSNIYNYIISVANFESIKQHYEKVLLSSYIFNTEKLRDRLPLELKDIILREITYINVLKTTNDLCDELLIEEFKTLSQKYNNLRFNQICSQILQEDDIITENVDQIEKMDLDFIVYYLRNVLCKGGSFNINDLTDYLNFKYAYKFCCAFYTYEKKLLNKYSKIFTDLDIQKFIIDSKNFIKKYNPIA